MSKASNKSGIKEVNTVCCQPKEEVPKRVNVSENPVEPAYATVNKRENRSARKDTNSNQGSVVVVLDKDHKR